MPDFLEREHDIVQGDWVPWNLTLALALTRRVTLGLGLNMGLSFPPLQMSRLAHYKISKILLKSFLNQSAEILSCCHLLPPFFNLLITLQHNELVSTSTSHWSHSLEQLL